MVISRERGSVRPRSSSELHSISLLFLGEKSEGFLLWKNVNFFFLSLSLRSDQTHFARLRAFEGDDVSQSTYLFHLISPSRAQEEETRARVTRAEQESLSLHVPREKKRGLVLYL